MTVSDTPAPLDETAALRRRVDALVADLASLGSTNGGLAHDLNNLLGVIIGNLDLLSERIGADPEIEELARAALDAALRGAEINQQLLAANRAARAA